jgi:hypothetical protein
MTLGKRLAIVGFVAAAALLAAGTGGFSAMAADRGVEVAVVDDSEAFVGYDASCDGDGDLSVTVTNRFDRAVDGGSVTVDGVTEQVGSLMSGGDSTVEFDSDEFEPGDPVTVEVSSAGLSATLHRSVPDDCVAAAPDVEGVRFTGAASGNAKIKLSSGGSGSLDITYWTLLNDGSLESGTTTVSNPSDPVNVQSQVPGSKFAAIYVAETDTTYVHQNLVYDDSTDEWSINGGSGSNTVTDRECSGELDFTNPPPPTATECWSGS